MTNNERLTYVDTAKFMAIWLVIISHSSMNSDVARFLFAFHVPLFFFLYGFVYRKKEDQVSVVSYLKKRVPALFGRILVPYLLLAFILGEGLGVRTLSFVAWGSLQSLNGVSSTHLWFLPCYFTAVLIFGLLFDSIPKAKWSKVVRGGVIALLSIISAFLNSDNAVGLSIGNYVLHFTGLGENSANEFYLGFPFALNVSFTGVALIYVGYLIRLLFDRIEDKNWLMVLIAILSAIAGIILFYSNAGNERLIAMSYAQYGNYVLFFGAAVLLSIVVLIMAKFIDNKVFSKYGQYTLAIYGFHLTLTIVGSKLMKILHVTNPNISAIVIGTITLVLSCALIPIIRYIDPYILGERKL